MDELNLYGQVKASTEIEDLLQIVQHADLKAQICESSHFNNGCYLMVERGNFWLVFEKIEQDEYLVRADVYETNVVFWSELTTLAETISNVLSQSKLQHRFEVYDSFDQLVSYFHFNWQ